MSSGIILEILYRITQFSSLLTIMSCNKSGVATRIIFPLFSINLSKSYSDIFFCVDILITLFTGIACYRKTEKRIMLFSGPKRPPAGCIIIINDIQVKVLLNIHRISKPIKGYIFFFYKSYCLKSIYHRILVFQEINWILRKERKA